MAIEHLRVAITEFKIGNKVIARQILSEILASHPHYEQAWLLMAEFAEKDEQKIYALRQVLAINPQNQKVREALNLLISQVTPGTYEKTRPGTSRGRKSKRKAIKNVGHQVDLAPEVVPTAGTPDPTDVKIRLSIEVETKPGSTDGTQTEVIAAVRTGPGLAKRYYDNPEPVVDVLPAPLERPSPAPDIATPGKRRSGKFLITKIMLVMAIILWMGFLGLMLSGKKIEIFSLGIAPATPTIHAGISTPISTLPVVVPSAALSPTAALMPTRGLATIVLSNGGTLDDPVAWGSGYRFKNLGMLAVEDAVWQAGQPGTAVVKLFFVCEREVDEICATEILYLEMVGQSGTAYPRGSDPTVSKPWFGSIINLPTYGSHSERGFAGFDITNPEQSLLLRVKNALDPGNVVYFKLP